MGDNIMKYSSGIQLYCMLCFIYALIFVVSVDGVCQNITMWEAVPEDQYDMNYHKIDEEDARPLGYKVGRYIYNKGESICVKVTGTRDRRVEVRFETEPAATFCVRSVTGVENEPSCTSDKTQGLCEEFQVDGDGTTTFEFYCTGQCAEADVTFWYRFTVCPYTTYDENEIWCAGRESEYPGGLLTIPFFTTTPNQKPVNGAENHRWNLCSLIFLMVGLNILRVIH